MAERRRFLFVIVALVGALFSGGADAAAEPEAETGSSDWRVVDVGLSHSCGIRTNGRLYCWGSDTEGKLGNGGTDNDVPVPNLVSGGFRDWTAVASGAGFTCGLRATHRLYCWGNDNHGQLGNGGANASSSVPTLVGGGFTNWTSVTAGAGQACGRRANGRLYCWGSDHSGQLGDGGGDVDQSVPRLVLGGITNWVAVTAGDSHTCGRRATGQLYCWGYDGDGQLGNGPASSQNRPIPALVAGGITNWTSVAAGDLHTCARRGNGRLYCWGSDSDGQLGDDANFGNDRTAPTLVAGGATNWTGVSAGSTHTCARRTNGRLWCWGNDSSGELGDGGSNTDVSTPVEVGGHATDWTALDLGGGTSCARITSGRLFCWGRDGFGQVGDAGTNTNQPRPVQVFGP